MNGGKVEKHILIPRSAETDGEEHEEPDELCSGGEDEVNES